MIILKQTTDTLRVVLNAAHTTSALECYVSYRIRTNNTFEADRSVNMTNGATPVTIAPAPAANTQHIIDYVSVMNTDSGSKTVTISISDNGTNYRIFQATLAVGEKIEFVEGEGWRVISNSGSIKQSINQGNNPVGSSESVVVLGTDVTNNNAVANTMQDVTGLSFPVVAGRTYRFKFVIDYTAAATTTGSRWAINGPTATRMNYESDYALTTTSRTVNVGLSGYDQPAASNASSAATGANIAYIEGFITPSADGTVIARFASEVAASAIVAKAGSYVEFQQMN